MIDHMIINSTVFLTDYHDDSDIFQWTTVVLFVFPHAANRCGHVLAAGDHQLPSTWDEKSLCLKLLGKMFGIETFRNFSYSVFVV